MTCTPPASGPRITLEDTPEELLDKISQYLVPSSSIPDSSLRLFSQVNKNLRRIALPWCWNTVTCYPKQDHTLEEYEHHITFFQNTPILAGLVRELKVKGKRLRRHWEPTPQAKISACTLARLVACFSNLSALEVQEVAITPCLHDDGNDHSKSTVPQSHHLEKIVLRGIDALPAPVSCLKFLTSGGIKSICLDLALPPSPFAEQHIPHPVAFPHPAHIQAYYSWRTTRGHVEGLRHVQDLRILHLHQTASNAGGVISEVIRRNASHLESILLGWRCVPQGTS